MTAQQKVLLHSLSKKSFSSPQCSVWGHFRSNTTTIIPGGSAGLGCPLWSIIMRKSSIVHWVKHHIHHTHTLNTMMNEGRRRKNIAEAAAAIAPKSHYSFLAYHGTVCASSQYILYRTTHSSENIAKKEITCFTTINFFYLRWILAFLRMRSSALGQTSHSSYTHSTQ